MKLKDSLLKELKRKGYFEHSDGRKVWEVANRSSLYMTPELSKAFLKLRGHPRYRETVIDIETSLLKEHSRKFLDGFDNGPYNLIDMGCGDGTKTKVFLEALEGGGDFRFLPVNAHKYLVNLALKNIKKSKFKNVSAYKPHIACLESLHEVSSMAKNDKYRKNIILLLGSTLASFDIHNYLFNLSQSMFRGDRLIIGNAIRTGERFVNIKSYKHPIFEEWFNPLIKELGFKDKEVEYGARFANGRVEGFYKIKADKKISHRGMKFEFKKDDEIIVAILYKYYEKELEEFCKMYFRDVELVKDKSEEYALVLCKK